MNKDIHITSINVRSEAELLVADHQSGTSAYKKTPITEDSVFLTMTGFAGDTVADIKHHGGNDKAICCYNSDHLPYWKNLLGFELGTVSPFGENLSLTGENALEENVFIGDRYQLGEALVEVSEPRGPCHMIGIRHNYKPFALHCQQSGYTGFYLRTLKEGIVKKTDKLIHLSSRPEKISVMFINNIRYHDPKNKEALERLVNLKELTLEWREKLNILLQKK